MAVRSLVEVGGLQVIEILDLTKIYGQRTVLDHLTLSIPAGEIFGLLGPNGAGKTTTIRLLTLLTQPSEGEAVVAGCRIPGEEQRLKERIGLVPQHVNLDLELTARENMELHGRLYKMPAYERQQKIQELLDFVELSDRGNDMVQTFSGGMKRRLMIARALMHQPQVLFLDEPTVGLDPQIRRKLWDLVRHLGCMGLTVLLTTHYIEEAENLCSRVAILEQGKLLALDTPEGLCRRVGRYVVEWSEDEQMRYTFFPDKEQASRFLTTTPGASSIRQANLEDVFVEMTGRKVMPS